MAGAVVVDAAADAPGDAVDVLAPVAGAAAVAVVAASRAGCLALPCRTGAVDEALADDGHSFHSVKEFQSVSLAGCQALLWCADAVDEALALDGHSSHSVEDAPVEAGCPALPSLHECNPDHEFHVLDLSQAIA